MPKAPASRQKRRLRLRPQRVMQALCLALFVLLLWQAAWPFSGWLVQKLPPDLFLRLDPAGMLAPALAARAWLAGSMGLVLALAATLVLGRFFCGWICPFGASVDVSDRLLLGGRPEARARLSPHAPVNAGLRRLKYGLALFIAAAAVLGVSWTFWLAPIPLITRLYALLLHPLLMALADMGLAASRPALDSLGLSGLYYTEIAVPRYAQQLFLLAFFGAVFSLVAFSPRFWCRNLCPAGGVFALLSFRPLLRRRVSQDCIECGLCQRRCPMAAIPEDPHATLHRECVVCQQCVDLCPVQAIRFAPAGLQAGSPAPAGTFAPSRRFFLLFGAAGVGGSLLGLTGLRSPLVAQGKGAVGSPDVIRPPGALPEPVFLARCVRCGECMKACPTNTLQPIGMEAGISGVFSPTVFPQRGPCEPTCTACGLVCPTGALRTLADLAEKTHAKLGTARVLPYKCLAWEHQRKCLVCDEVCPYDAIELVQKPGIPVPVPVVHESRCAGCGFCEFHCPVREQRAIVVEPMGALRLAEGSYAEAARAEGLQLSLSGHGDAAPAAGQAPQGYGAGQGGYDGQGPPPGFEAPRQDDGLPPGFENPPQQDGGLPPGFEEPPGSN